MARIWTGAQAEGGATGAGGTSDAYDRADGDVVSVSTPRSRSGDSLVTDRDPFAGPWFDATTAAAYIPCRTINAWHTWKRRHGILTRSNGSVAKRDLDRVLNRKKPRRVMHPASLANLRRRG